MIEYVFRVRDWKDYGIVQQCGTCGSQGVRGKLRLEETPK